MTVLDTSPNGKLRLRQINKNKSVVELDCQGEWTWCVYRSLPTNEARELFVSQVRHHQIGG